MAAEVKKLVQDVLLVKPEEEVQTIEKCLRLVGSNRTTTEQNIGFCLLAKMVNKCSPATMRAVQSRLANRFAQISDHFQYCGSLFVRDFLLKNPTAGDLHSIPVSKIILNCIDAAVQQSNDENIRKLAALLFALRLSSQRLASLLNTLDALLSSDKIKNVPSDGLELSTFGISQFRTSLTSVLFTVLDCSLAFATKPGLSIEREGAIRVVELGMKRSQLRADAFSCLRSLCVNTKHSMIPMIDRVVSTLVSELDSPDVELIKTLAFIANRVGPISSTVHKHFYVIFTALKHPLHEQPYGDHAGSLLASIIESSAGLIKPEVFVTVQKAVCESAIMHPDCPVYLQLLAAFMSLNNEYVPSPLHVARSVISRSSCTSEVAHRLRTLCDVASRPRTSDIANVKAKKTLTLKEEAVIEAPQKSKEEVVIVEEDVVVIEEDNDKVEEVVKDVEEMEVVIVEPSEDQTTSRKKKSSESAPIAPIKKKKVVREVKTNLLEGEASVDDILNLFDPS